MNGRMRGFRLVVAAVLAFAPVMAHAQEADKAESGLVNLLSWFDRQLEKGAAASHSPDRPQTAPVAPPAPAAPPEAKPAPPKTVEAKPTEAPEAEGGGLLSWIDEQLEKGAAASRSPDQPQATQTVEEPPPAPEANPAVQAEVKPKPAAEPDFVPPQGPIVLTDRPDAAKGKGAARGLLIAPVSR